MQGCRRICLVGRTGHARAPAGSLLHAAFTSAAVVTVARCDAASQDEVACLINSSCENGKQPPVQVCGMSLLALLPLSDIPNFSTMSTQEAIRKLAPSPLPVLHVRHPCNAHCSAEVSLWPQSQLHC